MTPLAYRMEILAEDIDSVPGALWSIEILDNTRLDAAPDMERIVVGVDPAASTGQTGIVVAGRAAQNGREYFYVLEDATAQVAASPADWAQEAVAAYRRWKADIIVGEVNNGGDMVEHVIRTMDGGAAINYKSVRATRGKYTRAEPISALFNPPPQLNTTPRGHVVGLWPQLEEELCSYVPGNESPNRLDAMVWAITELMSEPEEAGATSYV
jgi:phage terminase large subunit-like protein